MTTPLLSVRLSGIVVICASVLLGTGRAIAASGIIEGRILNSRTGDYVETVRVAVEGTNLETFSDSSGHYRVFNVPEGEARVHVFYTGMLPQSRLVTVVAGKIVEQNFQLSTTGVNSANPDVAVALPQMVVSTSRELDGAAIAINEQRFANKIVNVVSADEFGFIPEGSLGEFLKYLPGMSVEYSGGDARTISMGGVPAGYVPIAVAGFNLASAASSSTGRQVELDQFSMASNIGRVEVSHSPTPESPGSALAGSINMIPRSAFDRSRPVFSLSTYVMMRDDSKGLARTPGPMNTPTHKIHPGFDFSYVNPVNKRFGFTVSGGTTKQFTPQETIVMTWRGVGAATTVAANATNGLPDTSPDKPYLTNLSIVAGARETARTSFGTTIDYRLTQSDRVSLAFQYAFFDAIYNNRNLIFNITRVQPGQFSLTSTQGDVGFGDMTIGSQNSQRKSGTTFMPTFVWRHDGPLWKIDAGAGHSQSSNRYVSIDKGFFNNVTARRTGVTISFRDIFYLRPGQISVRDGATGGVVDPYSLSSYVLTSATDNSSEAADLKRSAYGNIRRDFSLGGIPVSLKAGAEMQQSMRDVRTLQPPFTFVGADGRATTTPTAAGGSDDGATALLDPGVSQQFAPYGFPQVQWIDNYKFWNLYKAHPEYFTIDRNSAYSAETQTSKHAEEVVSSAYFRGDISFFNRRLKLVGGVRAEQTNIKAEGPIIDPTRNYRRDAMGNVAVLRDANGNPLLGANGQKQPVLIEPTTINGVSNALAISRLTLIDRGQLRRKEYLRFFPSLNVSCELRENLIARAAVYRSLGRPDFNQYASGVRLPDTEQPANASTNRISLNNPEIKAWGATSSQARIEYYFQSVGQVSIGVFRRDFRNFFGQVVVPSTPEFLAIYGLDFETYGSYPVSTNYNITSTVRMEGVNADYKQALTFLPHWARGIQVFANLTATRATGDAAANFSGYTPRLYNWGISLTRPKFNVRANWNYKGTQRRSLVTGRGIEANTYQWGAKKLMIDLNGEYAFARHFSLFTNLRNVNDATDDVAIEGPNTPAVAQFRSRSHYGSLWTFGVKGTF